MMFNKYAKIVLGFSVACANIGLKLGLFKLQSFFLKVVGFYAETKTENLVNS